MATRENEKRQFWIKKMDAAYEFMNKIKKIPVQEKCEPMVSILEAVSGTGIKVQFSNSKINQQESRIFFLRENIIPSLLQLSRELNNRGYILKIEDAYRSPEMQKALGKSIAVFDLILSRTIWENEGAIPEPAQLFKRISALIATCPKVGTHVSGSALDITIITEESGEEVNRGGNYLELSELTPMDSPFISKNSKSNRMWITNIFRKYGFVDYPFEFWHYSQGDAYDVFLNDRNEEIHYGPVHLDTSTGRVTPIENPLEDLHSDEEIKLMIQQSLERMSKIKL